MKAPFPWFGGKSKVAEIVWQRFGNIQNYVEPFAGSLAVLLARDAPCGIETVNDKDAYLSNFWRAVQQKPEEVATWADWPVNENDLTARHLWLVQQKEGFVQKMEGDPDFCDPKIAGWWLWGICEWIGGGWCSGQGPWKSENGILVAVSDRQGISRKLPHLGDAGRGISRRRPHLGNAGRGITQGKKTNRKEYILQICKDLCVRLRNVRVCCGDWTRVLGPNVTFKNGITGVFLDPPYSDSDRNNNIYNIDSMTVAQDVAKWAKENGDNDLLRIALCGYEGEHNLPGWDCFEWEAQGGYANLGNGNGKKNKKRERIWFSPACIKWQQTFIWETEKEEIPQ